ncbi:hypothetical protein OC842_007664, partial [Tilletia horrida]
RSMHQSSTMAFAARPSTWMRTLSAPPSASTRMRDMLSCRSSPCPTAFRPLTAMWRRQKWRFCCCSRTWANSLSGI